MEVSRWPTPARRSHRLPLARLDGAEQLQQKGDARQRFVSRVTWAQNVQTQRDSQLRGLQAETRLCADAALTAAV
jgi:hypothetical protein